MQEMHQHEEMHAAEPTKQPLVQFSRDSICVSRKMLLTVGVLVGVFALGMLVSSGINNVGKAKIATKSRAEAGPIINDVTQSNNDLSIRERFPAEKGWMSNDLAFIRVFEVGIANRASSTQTFDKPRVEDWMWKNSAYGDGLYSYFNGLVHIKYGLENDEVPRFSSGEFKFQECNPVSIFNDVWGSAGSTYRCAPYNFVVAYTDNPAELKYNYDTVPEKLYLNIFKRVANTDSKKLGLEYRNIWTSFTLPKNEIKVLVIPNSEDPKDNVEKNYDGVRFNSNPVQVVLSTVPFGDLTD